MTKHAIIECTIYGLREKGRGEFRYIGQTAYPLENRLKRHWQEVRRGNRTARSNWMRAVAAAGGEVEIVSIRENAPWNVAEIEVIAHYRAAGARLLNHADGGQGWTPGKPKPEEWRERFREAQRRNWSRPEVRRRHREAVMAERSTAEGRSRMLELQRRTITDPEISERRIAAARRTKATDEYRAAQSERTKRQMADPKARERCREVNVERMKDPANRQKATDGARKGWADPVAKAERCRKLKEAALRRWAKARAEKV